MSKTWVVVADSSCAKIFKTDGADVFLEVADLVHYESKIHEQKITSDLPGSYAETGGSRHGYEGKTGIKEHEAERFAHQISDLLDAGWNDKRFNKLLIVADPAFLGVLRKAINPNVSKLITYELNKDLVKFSASEIKRHLLGHL